MEFKHTSVLYEESIEGLNILKDGVYVDGTLGGGGHSAGICEKLGTDGIFIGVDRDSDAIEAAKKKLEHYKCKKYFVKSNYSEIKEILKNLSIEKVNGALLDLGVSSFQLDNPERGFSYMKDAPLDMRMDVNNSKLAKDIVNTYTEKELNEIIKKYGEEKWAARIAKFIVERRNEKEIETTTELAEIIKNAIPAKARREGPHPAKRTFQAIRIEVNEELDHLEKAVSDFCDILDEKGRLCIITFHSLEDRIVKNYFKSRENACTCPKSFPVCVCNKVSDIKKINNKPIIANDSELSENHRARSAKLRVIEKKRNIL